MPFYPYACECGHTEDRLYSFGQKRPDSLKCPCGKRMTRRVTFPISVNFRGPGFTTGGFDWIEESRSIQKHGMNHWKKGHSKKYTGKAEGRII